MSPVYLMALDAGGGGGHCLLAEVESGRCARAFRPWSYPTALETGGLGCDLDLERVFVLLGEAAREALARAGARAEQVAAVAVTSMRHSTVVLAADGTPLFAVPNRDSRAALEAMQITAEHGDALYARTARWPHPLCTAARLRWLAANLPAAWQRAAAAVSLNDWIAHRLGAALTTDASQANETLLLDVATRDWAWDLVDRLDIPRRLLPALSTPGTRIGAVSPATAEMMGLKAGTPIGVGGGDSQCGTLGTGAVAAGQAAAILGTSAPLQLVLDRPLIDPGGRLWTGCHVVPGTWVLESNGGGMGEMLDWLARLLYPDHPTPPAMLLAEAGLSEPGARAIFSTLGVTVMNARDLSLPVGSLTLAHLSTAHDPDRRRHLARAVAEGMAFGLRANFEQVRAVSGLEVPAVHLGGGMSRSPTFAQLAADVLDRPVRIGPTREATALGAAFCAGVAAGIFPDLPTAARRFLGEPCTLPPDAARARTYHDLYATWQQLRDTQARAEALAARAILPAVLADMASTAARPAPALRPRVVVTADMDEEGLAALRALGDVEYASFRQRLRLLAGPTLIEALASAQVFVTEVDIVDAAALAALPDLRVVVACRGDAVNVDVAACSAFGVPVLHAPGRNAEAVADLTLAFLLMLARRLPQATGFLRQPDVEAGDIGRMGQAFTTLQGRELWRKTIGLIGCGAVGRAVARRLRPFGARVLVCDPYLSAEQATLAGAEAVPLDELLAQSDFVSLHAAVTDETRGLIDAAALARMKPGAALVNTARAALVDEDALAATLRSGHLAGAALDVFAVEPPGADHPLLALDSVIATPHVGGNTADVAAHQGRIIAEDLDRLLRGERPQHALNPQVLDGFDWTKPRRQPSTTELQALATRPAPTVSDLQRDRAARPAAPAPSTPAAAAEPPAEIVERVRRVLRGFLARASADATLQSFAVGRDVTLHFTLPDLGVAFHLRLRAGAVTGSLGDPDSADVELRMPADVLDGMFTGRINAMQAATGGRLKFSGDTVKAMTLQQIQGSLSEHYQAARAEVGDLGDLAAIAAPRAVPAAATVAAGDPRREIVVVVNELYAAQLITATGGNVSARVPGRDEIWITPSQLFKGDLRPEILVRVNLDGEPLDADALAPSSERLMHCAVYRARPDAEAVIHAHAPHATMLANTGLPFLPVSTEAAFFGEIPRVPFIMPGTEELAAAIAAALRESWAVLMQNHGLLVAGRSLRRAADMVEIVERSAEVILGCYAVGKPPSTLPPDVVAMLQKLGDLLA